MFLLHGRAWIVAAAMWAAPRGSPGPAQGGGGGASRRNHTVRPEIQKRAGAPDRIRTCDLRLRRPTLYPLSYRRSPSCGSAVIGREAWYTRRHRPSFLAGSSRCHRGARGSPDRRRPPPKRGPSLLPDSLIARASFTHGFPHYPNPNLPMALQSVMNRCANSHPRIDQLFPLDKGFGGLVSFTKQSGWEGKRPSQRTFSPPMRHPR
jgi:hypothetical protein